MENDEESMNPQKIEDRRKDGRKTPPRMEGGREGGAGCGKRCQNPSIMEGGREGEGDDSHRKKARARI